MPVLALCHIFKSAFHAENPTEFDFGLVRDPSPCHITFILRVFLRLGMCHNRLPPRNLKVHLTPKFFFGRDETVQLSRKEFANFISMWYF